MGINSIRPRSPHRTHLASLTAIKSRKENLKVECFTIAYMVMQHNTLKVQAATSRKLKGPTAQVLVRRQTALRTQHDSCKKLKR